ncbi:EamA family transporter [Chiayiivirga flava]|uniref:Drug/metabolite transporter (DMT)-like permease n=1 Tax=Chiayiivirga flava TaxID=659595 RepID=A0A7W8G0V6_9GAMM|nr:drug/metabolite transporter (DMT)-like permease [Chiayiivirga flava]
MSLRPRDVLLVALALAGFAANSVLCRMALSDTAIDPASFVAWRIGSGAVVLVLLTWLLRRESPLVHGDWRGATALFVYAVAFSYAYVSLHAGLGALLLFGAVQVTMIAAGLLHGERLRVLQWCGVVLACGGLVFLKLPVGGTPVPLLAAASMLLAGIAWGVYSLLGRGAAAPLAHTAANFVRAAPFALLLLVLAPPPRAMPLDGVLLAVLSGALASGVGYALWYAVLPRLRATQAGLLQLLVPVLTAAAGVALLAEPVDARLLLGGAAILGGVALVLRARPMRAG